MNCRTKLTFTQVNTIDPHQINLNTLYTTSNFKTINSQKQQHLHHIYFKISPINHQAKKPQLYSQVDLNRLILMNFSDCRTQLSLKEQHAT